MNSQIIEITIEFSKNRDPYHTCFSIPTRSGWVTDVLIEATTKRARQTLLKVDLPTKTVTSTNKFVNVIFTFKERKL